MATLASGCPFGFHLPNRCKFAVLVTVTLTLIVASFFYWPQHSYGAFRPAFVRHASSWIAQRMTNDNTTATPIDKVKRILYWTTFLGDETFGFGFGRQPFIEAGCPVSNCEATNDRRLLRVSDALIFHPADEDLQDRPPVRTAHQRYVFFYLETFSVYAFSGWDANGFFNWTMTYRRDSDVYMPYGALRRRNHSPPGDTFLELVEPSKPPAEVLTGLRTAFNRTKLIAWFVSKCDTQSRREVYAKELAKYIRIDVYGKCGTMTCEPGGSDDCDTRVLPNYKFYFSAENSLCQDYVTEKFYRALDHGVVPIVYGGADYSAYAPASSYINAADFKSPKELAGYLLLLDKNDALYSKYFDWRREWRVVNLPPDGWCELCRKLHDPMEPAKSYESAMEWHVRGSRCLTGNVSLLDF